MMLAFFAAATIAQAQTGPGLVLRPWPDGKSVEVAADAMFLGSATTDNAAADIHLRRYDVGGRYRSDQSAAPLFSFGVDVTYLDVATSDPALPDSLVDQSVAAGVALGETGGWAFDVIVGFGYAGDNPYGDDTALYAIADVIARHRVDDRSSWHVLLDYNGNRTFLPDVPLPGFGYHHRSSDVFSYTLGLPHSGFDWRPADRVSLSVGYVVPVTFRAVAAYEVTDGVSVFGQFDNRLDAFTLDSTRDHRRLFFQQRRIEAGVRVRPHDMVDITLAGGYAFDQEFESGFDTRDRDGVADVSDEPFIRAALNLRF